MPVVKTPSAAPGVPHQPAPDSTRCNDSSPEHAKALEQPGQITNATSAQHIAGKAAFKRAVQAKILADRNIDAESLAVWKSLVANLPVLAKQDLLPGDMLLRVEDPGDTPSHEKTIGMQRKPNTNGIADHKGDPRVIHPLIWVKSPSNPGNTEPRGSGEPEVVDVRGGIGTIEIMACQGTALQPGNYMVYRPWDANAGDWAAQIAMMWADKGKVRYSIPALRTAGRHDDQFIRFDQEAALQAVTDPFTNEPAFANNPEGSDICSSFPVRVWQAAFAQVTAAEMKARGEEVDMAKIVSGFSGLMSANPIGTAPSTVHHFLETGKTGEGRRQFEAIGAIRIEKALYAESPFPKAKL